MTNEIRSNDADASRFAQKTTMWYGWGSPVGLGLFILAIGGFIVPLQLAAVTA